MPMRLTTIYTRSGDSGQTGLADGSRLPKDHPRIEAIGSVDELNSALGVVLAQSLPATVATSLLAVQQRLFDIGGTLALPGLSTLALAEHEVTTLEQQLDSMNQQLPPLREFILPGGTPAAAHCQLARSICRRAERDLLRLEHSGAAIDRIALRYLNRLSDLLFVTARYLNHEAGCSEPLWCKAAPRRA